MCTKVYSSIIHNSPKVEPIQVSAERYTDNVWQAHTREYYSASKRNELLIRPTREVKREDICQVK